jgi:hypothetical protein
MSNPVRACLCFFPPPPTPTTKQCGTTTTTTTTMKAEAGVSRKDALVGAGAAAGALLLGVGGGLGGLPGAANAEFTPSQRKQQYFRYAPRIKSEWMCARE